VSAAPLTDWVGVLEALLAGEALDAPTTQWVMAEMLTGAAPPANTAAFLVALRAKGETPAEVTGLVAGMMGAGVPLDIEGPVVDTCGTGGDRSHTVNISTMAAVVAAAAGPRGQARQPGGLLAVRLGRHARGARGRDRPAGSCCS
jgi:anthranilate phosphoribosyltransferase